MPNFIEIKNTFYGRINGRTYVRTHGRTNGHLRPALLGPLWKVDLKIKNNFLY